MHKPRLKEKYLKEVVPALMEKFKYTSVMQVPKVEKVVVNRGIGAASADKKLVDAGVDELTLITGQKAVATIAKKSVSNFKLREGMAIGAKVTLRGDYMYEFIDRLISVALPRVRDFRGINEKGFDGLVITPWESRNRSFFQRSAWKRSPGFQGWISLL